MKSLALALATVFALGSLSCSNSPKRYSPTGKIDPIPLMIWVDPGSAIPKDDLLKACEEWQVMGIQCHLITSKSNADIRVYFDTKDPCAADKKGHRTLATAWKGGRIVFYRNCYGKMKSASVRKMFRAIATHEVGHQLGIWKHVPESCKSKKVKTHPNGKKICGEAVMNPLYEKDIWFVTPVDKLAFDIRDRWIGVVEDGDEEKPPGEPDCIYYGK